MKNSHEEYEEEFEEISIENQWNNAIIDVSFIMATAITIAIIIASIVIWVKM